MNRLVAALLIVGVMGASGGAWAAGAEGPEDAQDGPEVGLAAGQFAAGMGVALAGFSGAVATLDSPVAVAFLIATPFATGAAICGVGKWSRHNQASCLASIGGAYLGALTMIPLAVLGFQLDIHDDSGGEWDGLAGALMGVAAGFLVIQPLVGTIAWHMGKQPRVPSLALLPPPRSRLLAQAAPQARGRTRAPGQMTLTLLSARF
jgi:hypothetical protein